MKKINLIVIIALVQIFISCNSKNKQNDITNVRVIERPIGAVLYKTEDLIIKKISDNVYEHISYFYNNDLEKISAKGMIVVYNREAIVFNTASSEQISEKLIKCITKKMQCKINAIVVANIHPHCLAGLKSFHRNNIVSYASNQTITLAKKENYTEPQLEFIKAKNLKVGNKKVHLEYCKDTPVDGDIIGYFPEDKIIFGKRLGAKSENINNSGTWPDTVSKIKINELDIKMLRPQYEKSGGSELLENTVDLFSKL